MNPKNIWTRMLFILLSIGSIVLSLFGMYLLLQSETLIQAFLLLGIAVMGILFIPISLNEKRTEQEKQFYRKKKKQVERQKAHG